MGYAAYSGKYFSPSFSLALRGAGTGACGRGHAEGQDCSWGKLNLVSDFLARNCRPRRSLSAASIQKQRSLPKAEKPVEKSAGGLGPKLKPMRLSSTMPVSFKTKILCYMENAKEPFGPPVS
jgi:hypothetical protein